MLDRKLLRDLGRIRGQVITIALVIASGIAVLVSSIATYQSLIASQAAFYADARFATVFASAKRVPTAIAARIEAIDGIGVVETRIADDISVMLDGGGEPLAAHVLSLPADGQPQLNRLHLRQGRLVERDAADEVVVSEAFASANRLRPGDSITAILNGRLQRVRVVGIALSAEYVFATRPGDPIPDDRRYGILWMGHRALAAALNMDGAFNDVVATMSPRANPAAVRAALDDLLARYGGLVAYGRAEQSSHRFLSDEISQQGTMATTIPVVFLAVSVFLLHGMLDRLIRVQREQIAALKALGYTNAAVGWHYIKFSLVVVLIGAVLGVALGLWLGRLMTANYTNFFRFPELAFHITPVIPLLAVGVAVLVGFASTLSAVRSATRLAPAEAMRPLAPRDYRHGALDRLAWVRHLAARHRMVLRGLTDRPWRTAFTIAGIALAVPIIVLTLFWRDALDFMIDVQFSAANRADMVVVFNTAVPRRAEHEIAGMAGVRITEAYRSVPVRLRARQRSYRTAITGLPETPVLRRLVDADLRIIAPPADGLLLSSNLARRLGLYPGAMVDVDVLEGRQQHLRLPVTGLLDEMLGLGAYIRIGPLNRLLGEGDSVNSVGVVSVDPGNPALRRALLDRPRVASIADRAASLRQFRATTLTFVLVMAGILGAFSIVIAIGVIYNHARIALQERAWELASLRVLGFTRGEVAGLLLGELFVQLAVAVPLGLWLGYWMVRGLIALHSTEMFQIPAIIQPRSYALAGMIVGLSGVVSAALVRRQIDDLDLVAVLKARE